MSFEYIFKQEICITNCQNVSWSLNFISSKVKNKNTINTLMSREEDVWMKGYKINK